MFNVKRFLHTEVGKILISVILGLGVASLFRKVCKDKECIEFKGPVIHEIDGRIFKYGDDCYKYKQKAAAGCDTSKKIVNISPYSENPDGTPNVAATSAKVKYVEKMSETDKAAATAAAPSGMAAVQENVGHIFAFLNGRSGGWGAAKTDVSGGTTPTVA